MTISVIVYTSNTGFTKKYAELLGERTGLTVRPSGSRDVPKGSEVIYLGWVAASVVKGFDVASKSYTVKAVCGVCMGPTGSQLEEVRKKTKIPADVPLFTLQGGFDPNKLHGFYKFIMKPVLKKMKAKLESIENRTPEEELALEMVVSGKDLVDERNLSEVLDWYSGQ